MRKLYLATLLMIFINALSAQTIYTFNGNGNWTDSANWLNKQIPPDLLPNTDTIFINPAGAGECILNKPQSITKKASLVIRSGKKMKLLGNLVLYNSEDVTRNILNDHTYLVDTSALASVTESNIILNKSSTKLNPVAGDILIGAPTESNPDGLLRKLVSVNETESQFIASTTTASLNEAFKQLNIDYTFAESYFEQAVFRGASPQAAGIATKLDLEGAGSIAAGVKFSGSLDFNIPAVKFEYVKREGSLKPERVFFQADFNTIGSAVKMEFENETTLNVAKKTIFKYTKLPRLRIPVVVPTPVGPIVIPIPFTQLIEVNMFPMSLSGKVSWTIFPTLSSTLGFKYENGEWTNLCTYTTDATANELLKQELAATFSGKVTVLSPKYEVAPLGTNLLKAFFEIPFEAELTVQAQKPNYKLTGKIDVKGGVEQEFFTNVSGEYALSGNLVEKTILEGNFAAIELTTAPITSITRSSAVSGGNITDNGLSPIRKRGICWDTNRDPTISLLTKTNDGTGKGTFTSQLTNLDTNNTTYHVRAYAINDTDTTYGENITFKTKSDFPCNTYFLGLNGTTHRGLFDKCFSSGDFTLSVWIQLRDSVYPGTQMFLFHRYMSAFDGPDELAFYLATDGSLRFRTRVVKNGINVSDSVTTGYKPSPFKWCHAALTFSQNGECKMYADGNLIGSKSFGGPRNIDYVIPNTLAIGATYTVFGSNSYFNASYKGLMDEVAFAGKVFSPAQLDSLGKGISNGSPFLTYNQVYNYQKNDTYPGSVNSGTSGVSAPISAQLYICSSSGYRLQPFKDSDNAETEKLAATVKKALEKGVNKKN